MKNKNINLLGWILFIISAIGFVISSIGSFWSMFGSLFFLVAFTIYFCFLHSIRHGISLIYEIDNKDFNNGFKVFTIKALPLTVITAIFCLIGLYLLNNNYDLNSSILKTIFIGLASLTFPHILLEYFLEKNEK